jgi:voltage-gated potassium channel Kch
MYWSVSTLTTVGYGDIVPGKLGERMFAMLGMLSATTAFAYLLGTMASITSSLHYRRNHIVGA